MRGIDLISAATFLAEIGDLSRFQSPCELMAYLGLVPSEDSTGDCVKRGPITKAGNPRARRTLVECAWSYMRLLARFALTVPLENVHPLQGGILRLKHPSERRPGLHRDPQNAGRK
jgi:hypothetical protein